jgi:hypothetical protein
LRLLDTPMLGSGTNRFKDRERFAAIVNPSFENDVVNSQRTHFAYKFNPVAITKALGTILIF